MRVNHTLYLYILILYVYLYNYIYIHFIILDVWLVANICFFADLVFRHYSQCAGFLKASMTDEKWVCHIPAIGFYHTDFSEGSPQPVGFFISFPVKNAILAVVAAFPDTSTVPSILPVLCAPSRDIYLLRRLYHDGFSIQIAFTQS